MKALPRLLPLLILSFFLSACPTPSSPDFSLALNPSTLSFDSVNTNKSSNLSINKSGDFKDAVTFRVQNAPTGIEVTLSNVKTDSATVNVKLTQALAAKDYTVTLAGTSGSLNKTIELTVRVGQVSNPNLSVPTGFNASLDGNDKVLLGWQAVENASEYVLERSSDGNSYSSLATASTTSYTDSGVSINNRYHYRIKAKNASQESAFSAAAVVDIKAVAANEDTVIVVGEQDSKDVALQIPQGFFKSNSNVIVSSNPQNPAHYIDEVTLAGKQASFSFTGSNINPNNQAAIQVNIALNPQTIKGKSLESLALTDGDQMLLDVHIRGEDANGQKYYTNFLDIGTFQNNNALVGAGSVSYAVAPMIASLPRQLPSSRHCFELRECHISIQVLIQNNMDATPYNPFKTRDRIYRINTALFLNNDFRKNVSKHCASADQNALYRDTITQQVAQLMQHDNVIDNGRMPLVLVHGWLQLEYLAAFTSSTIDVLTAKETKKDAELVIQARNPFTKIHAAHRLSQIPRRIADFTSLTPEVCYWLGFYKYVAMHPSLSQHFDIYAFPYNSVNVRVADNARTLASSIKSVFGERKITILAHSMGGLVSQDYLNNYDNHVDRLITLGTPFRGSPLLRCTKVASGTGYCLKAEINNKFMDNLGRISDNPFENVGETALNLGTLRVKNILMGYLLNAQRFPATLDLAWDAPLSGSEVGNSYLRKLNGLGTSDARKRYSRNTAYFGLADFYVADNQLPYFTNTEGGLSACTVTDIADGYQNHDSVSCGMDFFGNLFVKGHAIHDGALYFRALSDGIVPMESATVSLERSGRGTSGTNYWQANSIGASYSNALIPDTRFVRLNHVQFMSGRVTPTDFIAGDTLFHNPTSTECQSSLRYTTACSPYFYALVGDLVNQKPNYPPQAVLNSDVKKGTAPLVVNFDGSESRDDNESISRYVFRFGDGDTSLIDGTESKVSHTYRRAGSYTASLTVYDAKGLHTTTQITIEVGATVKPTADFTFTPAAPVAGQAVTFNAKAHSSDSAVKYGFNFGDGSDTLVNTTGTATHTFAAAGSYNVTVRVEDAKGVKSEAKVKVVQVQAAPKPTADFTFTPAAPVAGQAVTFNAKAHSSDSAVKYGFNFGDGSNSVVNTTGTATHTFAAAGSYNVTVRVEDAKGVKSDAKVKVVQVQAATSGKVCEGDFVIDGEDTAGDIAKVRDCNEIKGGISIQDTNLQNLNDFANIHTITSYLYITNNGKLQDISGFSNLNTVGVSPVISEGVNYFPSQLSISNNSLLTNLNGLSNLRKTGLLSITNNPKLSNVHSLSSLQSAGGLKISSNPLLTSLQGINNLMEIKSPKVLKPNGEVAYRISPILVFNNNDSLQNIDALSNLRLFDGYNLTVKNNPQLNSLAGFKNISWTQSKYGVIEVSHNNSLQNVDGLPKVSRLERVFIVNNPKLQNLDGLAQLTIVAHEGRTILEQGVHIINNPSLDNLNGLSALKEVRNITLKDIPKISSLPFSLSKVTDNIRVQNTNIGSLTAFSQIPKLQKDIIITGNPSLASLEGIGNLTSIGRNLSIEENNSLRSLEGLDSLVSVGSVHIGKNAVLTSLVGLKSLSSIGGDLDISNTAALTSLAGLESLSSIGGDLDIRNNAVLTNLAGLESLSSIGGNLDIRNNAVLTSLAGLESLSSIRGNLYISNNAVLTSLAGLDSLSSIGRGLYISNNAVLTSLAGLENLSSIGSSFGGNLDIENNDALTSLAGLNKLSSIGKDLFIHNNGALTSLAGLEKLKEVKGSRKAIYDNPKFDCSPYNQNTPPYFPLTKSTGNKVNCTTQ